MNFQQSEFIDIHTHILSGLDDGPQDMAGSIEMARCYEKAGVRMVVATPHFIPGTAWASDKGLVLRSVQALQTGLEEAGIDLKVVPGMEIAYHKKLVERIHANLVLPLGESGYFLIEPSFHGEQEELLASLDTLLREGRKLILAHPERVEAFQRQPGTLGRLVDQGLLIQINSGSLLGYFGQKSKDTAELLRQGNAIHFIASDAHDHRQRAPLSATEWEALLASPGGNDLLVSCNSHLAGIFHRQAR